MLEKWYPSRFGPADLGEPFWPTRSGRAVLAGHPFWATRSGRPPVLGEPIWATRSGRAILGDPFWPSRSRSGSRRGSGRPDLAEPSWATSKRRSIHALGLRNHIFQPMKIFGWLPTSSKTGSWMVIWSHFSPTWIVEVLVRVVANF